MNIQNCQALIQAPVLAQNQVKIVPQKREKEKFKD